MKKIISAFLRTCISFLFIAILLYIMRGNYADIAYTLKGTRPLFFGFALATFLLAISLASFRLKLLIEAQNAEFFITFCEAISLTLIGYFFNNFLPTAIGGDVVKAYYLSKKTGDNMGSFTSVFVDRAIGLFTMMFMAFVALFFVESHILDSKVRISIYIITFCSGIAILFMMNKNFARRFSVLLIFVRPLEERIKRIYNVIHGYRQRKTIILKSVAISVISQLFFFMSIGILALAIGTRIPALDIFLRMPIISATSLLPSINGLGLREGSTVLLFGPLIGRENAFAVSVLWLFILFIVSIGGGIIYALSPQFKVRFKEIT